ncbi:hypothetical protein NEISICOT_00985 [Neisseria sicca ATCC 29256]|uniref:Uncharacterized protein n=1 Tax=Neisseria sicca ATCC 29256 TaxID=547045 RepID=C6M394_NEISI|nr:hypothetical protein NEISICOT_00985 [Neisseria sicca ATCC 29256]
MLLRPRFGFFLACLPNAFKADWKSVFIMGIFRGLTWKTHFQTTSALRIQVV